jgi:hypothetical protein
LYHFEISAKVAAMTVHKASKIQYIFFVFIILFNPIFASADVLFSKIMLSGEMLSDTSCHDDKDSIVLIDADSVNVETSDCCEDSCSCSEPGCHTSSALISDQGTILYSSFSSIEFKAPYYSNINSSPSSPPPIV